MTLNALKDSQMSLHAIHFFPKRALVTYCLVMFANGGLALTASLDRSLGTHCLPGCCESMTASCQSIAANRGRVENVWVKLKCQEKAPAASTNVSEK